MRALGISAFYHDSAAALIDDGKVVAAAQEERFTRKKHDAGFPRNAIGFCLAQAGLRMDDVDHVAFYDKPFLKFERLLETYLAFAPLSLTSTIPRAYRPYTATRTPRTMRCSPRSRRGRAAPSS